MHSFKLRGWSIIGFLTVVLFGLMASYGDTGCSGDCPCDYNDDGNVNQSDLFLFAMAYGR